MEHELNLHCERRGHYLIEASARRLAQAQSWHPHLTLTRLPEPGAHGRSQSFQGLKPLFDSAIAAIRYAADLGRSLVDEQSALLTI